MVKKLPSFYKNSSLTKPVKESFQFQFFSLFSIRKKIEIKSTTGFVKERQK